jgi:Calx-beta domain
MIIRSKAAGTGTPGCRRRPARIAAALTALVMTWMVGGGDARADRIVLKSGEVIEGSVIEATRNTVIVLRSIGGMRQMPIQDIQEVQVDLAQGQQIVGELLGWADGVYEVRSGDEVVRVGESGIVSREPRQQTARLLPTRPRGAQQGAAAAAPPSAPAEQSAEPAAPAGPAEQDRIRAAADAASDADAADPKRAAADGAERQGRGTEAQTAAARQDRGGDTEARAAAAPQGQTGDTEARAAAERESQAAATRQSLAAAARQSQPSATEAPAAAEAQAEAAATTQSQAAAAAQEPAEPEPEPQAADAQEPAEAEPQAQARADAETAAESEDQAAADRQSQAAAGEQQAALGDPGILAVKASVDPPAPGARNLVFNIELSQPAKQTVVLIYGTVDGTAKAGEDYEAQQGMVTLAPGARTAEVRVPLIEGAPEDGDKRFELVLMADPKVAEVVDRRVIATIKGAD